MNPLTLVKRIQKINSREAALGISEGASWHAKYKESAYVFIGGIPYDLTEGDLLAVFAQYGEVVDVNLVRDKGTGKSKGFAFLAYEDQRSTNLAVDNLNGAQILGRIIRVDHVTDYKKKEEEDEEERQKKREERGVCRAFQRGECTRGASCKFSHDEQRAANTGWGEDKKSSRWGHDKFKESTDKRSGGNQSNHVQKHLGKDVPSRASGHETSFEGHIRQSTRREEKTSRRDNDEELGYIDSRHDKRGNERARKYGNAELDRDPEEGSGREIMRSRRQEGDKSREDSIFSRGREKSQRQDDIDRRPMTKDDYLREEKTLNRLNSEVGRTYRQDHDRRDSNDYQDKRQEKRNRYDDHDDVPRSREDRDKREERRLERYENDKSKSKIKR